MKLVSLFLILVSLHSYAGNDCREVDRGNAFFDTKKSSWRESEQIKILDCKGNYFLTLNRMKPEKVLR